MKRISRKIRNVGFGGKIFMIFVVLLMFLVMILSTVLYRYFQETVEESVKASISNSIGANESSVASILERIDIGADLICDDNRIYSDESVMPNMYTFLKEYNGEDIRETLNDFEVQRELMKSYFSFLGASGEPYECILYVDEQNAIYEFLPFFRTGLLDKSDIGIYQDKSVVEEEWYVRACTGDSTEFVVEQDEVNQRIIMYKPIVCNYVSTRGSFSVQNERLGVLYISFAMSWIAEVMEYNNITEESEVFLVNEDNDIIYSGNGEAADDELVAQLLREIQPGISETIAYKGEQCVIQYSHLADNISMVTIVPASDIKKLVSRTISVIFTMTVVIIVCGILISFMITEYIIRPVRRLSEHMESGKMEQIICENVGEDEIGKLYKGFNSLMEKNDQLIQDVYREAEEKRKVELRALQSQINPHFVYNTLDTVCGLSLLRGDNDIADILTSLSQIMRYNTKRPDELVPLSKEMEIIHKYETIQSACYEDGLTFIYHLQEEAMNILVPKLIIQPLVENAILHGMDLKTRQGSVTISSSRQGNELIVDVVDNGTDAPIEQMNCMLQEQSLSEKSDSLGIRNVHERLKRVYNQDGKLIFQKNEQGNTVARIIIRNCFKQDETGGIKC